MKRVFFLGAGASRAAGMPLTNEITAGVAHSLVNNPNLSLHRVIDYLEKVHHVTPEQLIEASHYWNSRYVASKPKNASDSIPKIPSIICILSLLDVFIAENSVIYDRTSEIHKPKQVDRRELERTRERIVQCLALAFENIQKRQGHVPQWLANFTASLSASDDSLITTNWDILLDRAIIESQDHPQSGQEKSRVIDYGTDARIVDFAGNDLPMDQHGRPKPKSLYKLHGSFGWLYCQRCTNLYSNPEWPIATLGFGSSRPKDASDKCHCDTKLFSVLVTPTFIKSYENRHLGNIWAAALRSLTEADQWHFVGYSFPSDDLNIRALLIKALKIRSKPPAVLVASRDTPEDKRAFFEAGVREILGREKIEFSYIGAEAYLTNISSR